MKQPLETPARRGTHTVHRVDTTTSTQDDLRSMTDATHLTTVLARRQTHGRGRRGRSWESGPDQSLLASTLVVLPDTELLRERIGFLTLIGAAAMRAALADLSGADTFNVKFPNDIVVGDRKIAGVLGEFLPNHSAMRGELCAAIGVGVNITQAGPELVAGATSLATEGFDLDQIAANASVEPPAASDESPSTRIVELLLDRYLIHLDQRVATFAKAADTAELIGELNANLYGRGTTTTVAGQTGTIAGLTANAHLILRGEQDTYVSPADVAMFVESRLTDPA